MAGVTPTQSIRFGQVTDGIDWATLKNEADDIAVQLDQADTAKTAALTRPSIRIYRNAALACPVNASTAVPFDGTDWDTHGMGGVGGATPTRVTVSASAGAGHYMVAAMATMNTTSWTRGDLQLWKNAGLARSRTLWFAPGGTLSVNAIIWLGAVNDYLELKVYHEGGASDTSIYIQLSAYKLTNN